MFKLLVTSYSVGIESKEIKTDVIDFEVKWDADVAFDCLMKDQPKGFQREVTKLY